MDQTVSSLVKGITDFGDHQKWFEFDHLYRPMIHKVLRDKGLRSDELDDAVQEVYLSMLSTIERFQYDPHKGRFRSWLSKIVQRAASARRRRPSQLSVDPHELEATCRGLEDPFAHYDDECIQLCLKLARTRFDERTWMPFFLRVIEEAPMKEVEQITKMNRNAIYQSVHRVKQCLRQMLTELDRQQEDRRRDE